MGMCRWEIPFPGLPAVEPRKVFFIKFCTFDCVADAIIAHANILNQSAQRDMSAARHRVYEVVISDIFRR